MPIDVQAIAQRLIDLYDEDALNVALNRSRMLLDTGDLMTAAALARAAVVISEIELTGSSTEAIAPH